MLENAVVLLSRDLDFLPEARYFSVRHVCLGLFGTFGMASKRKIDSPEAQRSENSNVKRCKTLTKYCKDYNERWQFITASKKGTHYAFCRMCNCDINIAHSGGYDVERHIKSKTHEKSEKSVSQTPSIKICMKKSAKEDFGCIKAEVGLTEMLAELNLPLATSDAMCKFFRKMFPDSPTAQGEHSFFLFFSLQN